MMDLQNREFFISENQTTVGPISFKELRRSNVQDNALIWFEGLPDWKTLNDLPELKSALRKPNSPPPLPIQYDSASETVKELESGKNENFVQGKAVLSSEIKQFVTIWIVVHIIALITSYSEISIMNDGSPDTGNFWPIVDFISCGHAYDNISRFHLERGGSLNDDCQFHGIFKDYDWSEFAVYMIVPIVVILRGYSKAT